MPRVHFVKKARKDNPVAKRGESYYWWKFRYGPKRYSKTQPKASELTQSQYLSVIYECQERFSYINDPTCMSIEYESLHEITDALSGAQNELSDIADSLEELIDQYEESASNIEEHFQYSELAENLRTAGDECQSTVDALRDLAQECEDAHSEVESLIQDFDEAEDVQDELVSDIEDVINNISWDEPNFDFHEV